MTTRKPANPPNPPTKVPAEPELREVGIDFGRLEPYECGAILVALLAYPEPDTDEEMLGSLLCSLCHQHLQDRCDRDPEWANSPQSIKPIYAFVKPKQQAKDFRQLERRLRDRMVAARMGIAFLQEVETGKLPKLPEGIDDLSLNKLSAMVLDDLKSDGENNVETRVWRPSLPVIHIATATAVVIDQIERIQNQSITYVDIINDARLTRSIIDTAAKHADLFARSKRLKIHPNALIRVRATG